MDMSRTPSAAAPPSMDRRIERKPWKKWAPAAGAMALVAAAAVGWMLFSPGAGARAVKADDLEITEVQRAPFADYVPARAAIEPEQTVFVDAVEGGRVERLVTQDGAMVAAGQVIAVLSNPQLEREVGAQEAEISGRISDVRGQLAGLQRSQVDRERDLGEANYNRLRAEEQLQRRRTLHQKGYVSDAELKTVSDEAAYHRARVQTIEAGGRQEASIAASQAVEIRKTLQQLEENLAAVRGSLDALYVRAPTPGRLTGFELQPGQTVKAADRVAQIDSEGAYKLVAQVDEFNLGRVSLGQRATARFDGRAYALRVSRILPQVRDGRFQVEMTFDGALPGGMRRGQTLDVEITLGDTRPALVLPNGPFIEATGGNWVFVLDEGGKRAERRSVRTGRRNPQLIEVTSGLRPGERVVTSSYDGFAKQTRLLLR